MAFNFPSGATSGQQYTTDNGIIYEFNGQTWTVVATPASNTLVGNVTIDGGLELTGSVSGGYSRIHFVSESSGEVGSNLSTIQMVPDINSPSSEQILIIDPTGGFPNHIHLRPGGPMDNSSTSIILGGENSNVSVVGGTNPPVQITSNNYLWQFNTDGTLIFPDSTTQTTAYTGPIETGSFATTGSNVFKSQQIISGALTVSISANAYGLNENPTQNNIFWSYIPNDTNTTSIEIGWIANIETVGIYTVTNVEYDYPFVKITLDDVLLELPYRCNGYFSLESKELKFGTDGVLKITGSMSVSGSITGSTNFDTIVNKPTLVSGSSQLTESLDLRYTLSGSSVEINTSSLATTGSNNFVGDQVISGSLTISGSSKIVGTTQIVNNLIVTGSSMFGSGSFNVLAPEKFLVIQDDPENYNIVVGEANTDNYSQIVVWNKNSGISASSDIIAQADNGLETNMYADLGINSSNFTGNGNGIGAANDAYVYGKAKDFWVGNLTTQSLYLFANEEGIPDATLSSGVFTFDTPIVANAGITGGLDYSNLTNLPSIVSSSQQITDFGFITSSQTIDTSSLLTISSYQIDSSSFDDRINNLISAGVPAGTISGSSQLTSSFDTRYAASGSNLTYLLEAYANETYTLPGGFTEDPCRYSVVSVNENVPSNWFNTSTYRFTPQKAGYWEINACYDVYRNSEASMAIRKNGSIVASAGSFNAVAQEVSKIIYLNGSTDYIDIVNTGGGALQRYQYQQRSWFQAKFVGIIDSSAQLPSGLVSGSSQLTSSYDSRYVLSGSVSAVPAGTVSGSSQLTSSYDSRYVLSGSVTPLPNGIISGSSQLTSSYDGRYILTASFNAFTASAQAVTTGSNSFNGTQTITGSLIITTGSFVGSQILANTSSLYLTSGSNMYVQNNGVVEITGSLIVSGSTNFKNNLIIGTGSGAEGGQIDLAYAQSGNTTLTGSSVSFDVYGNKVRIFENGGSNRGVSIDLSKTPTGVGGDLIWKTSNLLSTGSFVSLDNIKAGPTRNGAGGGYAGLSIAAVSTTFIADISGVYSNTTTGGNTATTVTYTTTAANSAFGWGFLQGQQSTYIVNDTTNNRVYRIILMIGASYNNNFTSIERLY